MTDSYRYGFFQQLAGSLRRVPVREIKRCLAVARENGIEVSAKALEAHCLCGGHIEEIVEALALAQKEGIPTGWNELAAIDLAGRHLKTDVLSVVKACAGGFTNSNSTCRVRI